MATRKQNEWDLKHSTQFYNANRKFFGVPGELVETDFGVEQKWEENPDRQLGIYLMLCDIHDMLMEIHDELNKK